MSYSFSELKDFMDNRYLSREELVALFSLVLDDNKIELLPLFFKYDLLWREIYTFLVKNMLYDLYCDYVKMKNFDKKFCLTTDMINVINNNNINVELDKINKMEILGLTLLHFSVWSGNKNLYDKIKLLSNINHQDKYGRRAIEYRIGV